MITVLDFETTSVATHEAWPTEIALVSLDFDLNEIQTFQTLIKPPRNARIDPKALQVSRLTIEELQKASYFDQYWPQIAPLLTDSVVIAHYAQFDMQILQKCLLQMGIEELPPHLCTLKMSRRILNNQVINFKLGTLCDHFGIYLEGHRALEDARATAEILRRLAAKDDSVLREIKSKLKAAETFSHERTRSPNSNSVIKINREAKLDFKEEIDDKSIFSVLNSSKTQVVLTGEPTYGKEEFSRRAESLNLRYQETSPGGKTIFVVVAQEYGERKIRIAKEKGIPVLSQRQFDHLFESQKHKS